ncbi:M14 family metallopeptidase [Fimbriiglobus ruber]|uniref:Peptidase M14 domain-containing protein n=1 Tax=Fimbriiglobus ruber TaxID=1908690 RepID=A0A225D052_9BACT|nr:M14 family metallopeptidase [Fimbriiglobus ruber]OWK34990.1 hypothetical protein FRUB_09832 [Fimbriiglobus ruber]
MFAAITLALLAPAVADLPRSRAEQTDYTETSRLDDVNRFFSDLQQHSDFVRVGSFGKSREGRDLPFVVLADPPVAHPRDARATGKPVVLVMANIHAGEVEGKEAVQHLARRVVAGDLKPLLGSLVLLIAPVYNVDGNEKIDVMNRTAQNGPVAGVGVRENADGLDLNRDFMKLDSPEARALVGLFDRWDPLLIVDLHTTNGSYHGYHLTYSIPLNPATDPRLAVQHRETLIPALARTMSDRHKFRTYYYGNFSGANPRPLAADGLSWQAFSPAPRVGTNYFGLRNRFSILSEAYSYMTFRRRVEVTEAFVEEIWKYVAANAAEMTEVARRADADAVRRGRTGPPVKIGAAHRPKALSAPVDILVGEVKAVRNPRSGRDMTAMVEDKFVPLRVPDFGAFEATRTVDAARMYLFPPGGTGKAAADNLRQHGVVVEELTAALTADVETVVVEGITRGEKPSQGHREVRLAGQTRAGRATFPAGTVVVRTAQPLGTLAAYLLDPESDDGLTTWNVFDPDLAVGRAHPVARLRGDVRLAAKVVGGP